MPGIFVNYRRDDAPGVAGRLYDYLAKKFSRRDLFMDVDAIKPGLDFVKQLDSQVSNCDVLLALIGPNWLAAKDEKGARRLSADRDYVRIEIAAALKRDIPVIPILIDGARLPSENELPEDLASLSRRHALELRHTRFAADAEAIVASLKDHLAKPKKNWIWPAAAALLLGAIALAAGLYLWSAREPSETKLAAPAEQTSEPQVESPAEWPAAPSQQQAETPAQPQADTPSAPPSAGEGASPTPKSEVEEARKRLEEMRRRLEERKAEAAGLSPQAPAQQSAPIPVSIEGLSVALGDTRDKVKFAYPSATTSEHERGSEPPYLQSDADGLRFSFFDDDTLKVVRMDAPFKGSVLGVRIGDSGDLLSGKLGQHSTIPWASNAYLYKTTNGAAVRYDLDSSNNVRTIYYIAPHRTGVVRATGTLETLSVVPGVPYDRVKAAYPTAAENKGDLDLPLDGVRFEFTKEDNPVLRLIVTRAPFIGSINGVRLGDMGDDVIAKMGRQPNYVAQVYSGSGYVYQMDGYTLRFDVNKSNKVVEIWQILDRE
jgi:hypothetical protein